jgi:RNA polymerase sigma-70 factor, ECF subfamily
VYSDPPDPTDEALVARVVLRDEAAFAMLYDRYGRVVYTLAAHTLGPTEAEEVVQDVFLRLWQKAHQFDVGRNRFAAWFMAIARHRVVDSLKSHGQRRQQVALEDIEHLLATAKADLEDTAWQQARGAAALSALQDLPPEQRQVIVLAYFGGLSQSTLAERLGWPLGTVKKRIRLGLQKLRAALRTHETIV